MDKYIDAIRRILNPFHRAAEPVRGDKGYCIGRVVKDGINREKRQVTATLSTASIDRYGESVLPTAFEKSLPRFLENPKFLGGHAYGAPGGFPTSIGHWVDVQVKNDALVGTAQFLPAGDELTDKWWFRFEHGAQRTFSVGFIAHNYEMREFDVDGKKQKVRTFTEAELLEVSAVEIPANADAMLMTFGLDQQLEVTSSDPGTSELLEKLKKHLEELLTDPLGPVPVAIKNAMDDWHAQRGHSDHDHGDPYGDGATRRTEDEVAKELQRTLDRLRR